MIVHQSPEWKTVARRQMQVVLERCDAGVTDDRINISTILVIIFPSPEYKCIVTYPQARAVRTEYLEPPSESRGLKSSSLQHSGGSTGTIQTVHVSNTACALRCQPHAVPRSPCTSAVSTAITSIALALQTPGQNGFAQAGDTTSIASAQVPCRGRCSRR